MLISHLEKNRVKPASSGLPEKRSANLSGYWYSPKRLVIYKPVVPQAVRSYKPVCHLLILLPNYFYRVNSLFVCFLNDEGERRNRDGFALFREILGVGQNHSRQCFVFAQGQV